MSLKVLIVDDQQMFREGIRHRLEQEPDVEVVGEAPSAEEAFKMLGQACPDIIILDIRLPGLSGIEAARFIRQRWPQVRILMLTGYEFDQYVRAAARVGIDGYLLKDSPQETLVQALRDVANGGAVLQPRVASKIMKSIAGTRLEMESRQPYSLTVREMEVIELVFQGLRNVDIANRLSISVRTVEAHVGSIMAKLGATTRAEALRIAIEKNLIK